MASTGDVVEKIKSLTKTIEGNQTPAERKETAAALMALLDTKSETYGGHAAVDAALAAGLPSVLRYRLDSMDGDWMAEAKNGAMDLMDELARLPQLVETFHEVTDIKNTAVNAKIEEQHAAHSHGGSSGHGHSHGHTHDDAAGAPAATSAGEGGAPTNLSIADLHQELKDVRK